MQHTSLLYCSTNVRDNVVRGASFWSSVETTPLRRPTPHRSRSIAVDGTGGATQAPPPQLGDMHRRAGKRRRRLLRPDYTPSFLSSCAFARLTASCAPPRSSAVIPPLP
jgi:hypothetical protein